MPSESDSPLAHQPARFLTFENRHLRKRTDPIVSSRRAFVRTLPGGTMVAATRLSTNGPLAAAPNRAPTIDPPAVGDWLLRWEKSIIAQARHRFADSEFGDEPGWLVSPFLNRFYYGYLATQDRKWVANPEPIS